MIVGKLGTEFVDPCEVGRLMSAKKQCADQPKARIDSMGVAIRSRETKKLQGSSRSPKAMVHNGEVLSGNREFCFGVQKVESQHLWSLVKSDRHVISAHLAPSPGLLRTATHVSHLCLCSGSSPQGPASWSSSKRWGACLKREVFESLWVSGCC